MGNSPLFTKKARVDLLLKKLEEKQVQAAFFCIGNQFDPVCTRLVQEKGHFLCNHSFNHLHLSETSVKEFERELEATEALFLPFEGYRKWFRFPYLDYGDRKKTGGSEQKRLKSFQILKDKGYLHAYATVNTFDWYLNGKLKEKPSDFDRLKEIYLLLLLDWVEEYHRRWKEVLKMKFVDVLLLHQNDLNALCIDDIIVKLQENGWTIVSPEKAYETPIPYLAHFANTKRSVVNTPPSLSIHEIDTILNSGKRPAIRILNR